MPPLWGAPGCWLAYQRLWGAWLEPHAQARAGEARGRHRRGHQRARLGLLAALEADDHEGDAGDRAGEAERQRAVARAPSLAAILPNAVDGGTGTAEQQHAAHAQR